MSTLQRKAAPKKARAYHKGNVAKDLYAAALEILKTERFEDVSVRRLTQIVGVTPANFYNHYPSLSYLMQLIAADGFRQLAKIKRNVWGTARSRKDAARQTAIKYVEFAIANKQLFRIMFGQIPDDQRDPALRGAADEGFGDTVELVYGKSLYDPNDIPGSHERAIVAYTFFALIYGLARLTMEGQFTFKSGKKEEMTDFVSAAVETFINGSCALPFASDDEIVEEKAKRTPRRAALKSVRTRSLRQRGPGKHVPA